LIYILIGPHIKARLSLVVSTGICKWPVVIETNTLYCSRAGLAAKTSFPEGGPYGIFHDGR
jgi:hypothetical protein